MMAERGSRPAGPRDQRYKWAYIFGAVCAGRGIDAGQVLPHANTAAMNLHLAEISALVTSGAHAIVHLDGAGWHRPGEDCGARQHQPASAAALRVRAERG